MGAGSSEEAHKKYFNSIYWESRTWETDKLKSGGIRLNRDRVVGLLKLPGKLPIESFHSPWGIQFSKSIMTMPSVPPAPVILLWQRLFQLEDVIVDADKPTHYGMKVGPYLTLADFGALYKYLASVSTIDGDEAAWASVAAGVLPLDSNATGNDYDAYLVKLGQVYGSSFIMASVYASLCGSFGMREGVLGVLTPDQWLNQKFLRRVSSAEDYEHVINELVTKLIPAPNYNLPSQSCFDQGMGHTPPSLSIADLGWMQGWLIGVFYHYMASYPDYERHMSRAIVVKDPNHGYIVTTHHYLNTWERVSSRIVTDWKHLFGEKVTYAQMKEKWPGSSVVKPIDSCSIVLADRRPVSNFWQPSPTINEIKDMMAFDGLFHDKSQNQISTEWITRIGAFMNRLKIKPTESGFNASALKKQVEDQRTTEVGKLAFQQLCQLYDGYVGYERLLTNGWEELKNGEWDESGHTEKERKEIENGGITPSQRAAEQLREYPNPHLLDAKEYAAFLRKYYPIPETRKKPLPGVMLEDHQHLVQMSVDGYNAWARLVTENRAKTGPNDGTPIGKDFKGSVDFNGTPTKVYNFYPDYGVWDLPDVRTGWDKFLNFMLNPYKSLYGETLLNALIGQAKVVFDFMKECFDKASGSLSKFFQENGLWLLGFGVVGVIAIREVGNASEKIKR